MVVRLTPGGMLPKGDAITRKAPCTYGRPLHPYGVRYKIQKFVTECTNPGGRGKVNGAAPHCERRKAQSLYTQGSPSSRNPPLRRSCNPDTFASKPRCSCRTSGIHCHCCRPRVRWSRSAPSSCTARRPARSSQHDGVHTMAAHVHGDTAQVSCNGLASCSCMYYEDRRARRSLATSSSLTTIVGSSMLAMHQHHTADCAVRWLYCASTAQARLSSPSRALCQGCIELGSRLKRSNLVYVILAGSPLSRYKFSCSHA